jgi:hypothetical protein
VRSKVVHEKMRLEKKRIFLKDTKTTQKLFPLTWFFSEDGAIRDDESAPFPLKDFNIAARYSSF